MEILESVKATLAELVESAGENGITEGQAVIEITKRHKMGYYECLEALRSVYQDAGVERTPEHTGKVISYRKAKQELEESAAVRMARSSANRTAGEKQRQEIISQYRR